MSEERDISTQPPDTDPAAEDPTPADSANDPGAEHTSEDQAPRLRVQQQTVRPPSGGGWLPGPPWAWVLGAVGVFALAAILAFASNGGGGGGATSQAASDETATDVDAPAAVPEAAEVLEDAADSPDEPVGGGGSPVVEALEQSDDGESPPEPAVEPDLTGFQIPIDGACLTDFEGHLPGSPREYRNGTHEGWDFYGWASCRTIDQSTAVLAAKAGTVIRVDREYTDITPSEWEAATSPSVVDLPKAEQERLLDLLRGRQVWIDHGDGVVTRYAHLSAVAAGLAVGDEVRQGEVVAFVGESGQLPALEDPGSDLHLHFEIRVGDGYLGEGLPALEARELYVAAFLAEETP